MARKKVYNGPHPPIFGKRHFKRLASCLKSLSKDEDRVRFGAFMTAVFMDDNPQFDKDIFLKESGVIE
jgi:hypothetical protein